MHGVRHESEHVLDATSDLGFKTVVSDLLGGQRLLFGSTLTDTVFHIGGQRIGNGLASVGTIGIYDIVGLVD